MNTDWLKTSIPGIIILGAFGSIVAIYLLKLLKWFAARYLSRAVQVYVTQHARPYVHARALARRFYHRGEVGKLVFFSTSLIIVTAIESLFLFMAVCWTIFSFWHTYPATSWWQFLFVAVAFVLTHGWLKDMCALAGIWQVLMREEDEMVRRLVKKGHDVWKVLKLLDDLDAEEAQKKKEANKTLQATATAPAQVTVAENTKPSLQATSDSGGA